MLPNRDLVVRKFSDMIDVFREGFENLSEEEKTREQKTNTLKFPCQFHIVSSPDSLKHVIFKTHLVELKDKSTKLIQLEENTLIEQLVNFSQDSIWSIPSKDLSGNKKTLRDEIEKRLLYFDRMMGYPMDHSMEPPVGNMVLCGDDRLASWIAFGCLDKIDFNSTAKNFLQEYKKPIKKESSQVTLSTPHRDMVFGTYFYPPILIVDSQPTFIDRLALRHSDFLQKNIIETKFTKHDLLVTRGGLICVGCKKELAEKILNTIMATALIHGVQCYVVRRTELAQFALNETTREIAGASWSYSSLRMELFDTPYDIHVTPNLKLNLRTQVNVDEMKLIIRKAEEIWGKNQHHFLRLLLDAATHLNAGEYSQSFIMSWTVLEHHLSELWTKKQDDAGVTNSVKKALDRWDINRIVEVLHLDKELSENDYNKLKLFQNQRNKVVHAEHEITEKDAKNCYELAHKKIIAKIPSLDATYVKKKVLVY